MTKSVISDKASTVTRIRLTLAMAVLTFLLGGVFVFSPLLSLTVGVPLFFLYLYAMLKHIELWCRTYRYYVDDRCIKIHKGIFFSKDIILFKNKIQYTQLLRTPLEHIFHTCTIIYHTAGAVVYLSEIDIDTVDGVIYNEEKT